MATVPPKDDDPGGVGDGSPQHSYFAEDPDAPLPEDKAIVIDKETNRPVEADPEPKRSERAPPPPPRDTPRAKPGEGVDELQRQLDRERETSRRAEQAAAQAMQRAALAEARAGQATQGMIDNAIEAAVRASDQAAARFHAAMDISDHANASKAQIEIADARHNLLRLQEQKQVLQDQAEAAKRAPQPQQQRDDPDANLRGITAQLEKTGYRKSADWLRQHPDMVADKEGINRVDGAHGYVVNVLKVPIESDRYFDEMEKILLDGEDMGGRETARRGDRRPAVQRAAPVSRSAPSLRSGRSERTTITLTGEQRAFARDVLGMTDEEYAKELAAAEDSGKLLRMSR